MNLKITSLGAIIIVIVAVVYALIQFGNNTLNEHGSFAVDLQGSWVLVDPSAPGAGNDISALIIDKRIMLPYQSHVDVAGTRELLKGESRGTIQVWSTEGYFEWLHSVEMSPETVGEIREEVAVLQEIVLARNSDIDLRGMFPPHAEYFETDDGYFRGVRHAEFTGNLIGVRIYHALISIDGQYLLNGKLSGYDFYPEVHELHQARNNTEENSDRSDFDMRLHQIVYPREESAESEVAGMARDFSKTVSSVRFE